MFVRKNFNWQMTVLGSLTLLLSVGCTHYATKGEQLYLHSKNGKGVKTPAHLSTSSDEENAHLYDLAPQKKKNPIVSLLPPDQKGTEHA